VSGTARRGALDRGIVSGGKTGTTQAYRDAWYVGFTGNYTTAVWFGNDDYTSTNNMTGGSLPAMTFKRLMEYAHQGIELRPIPGIDKPFLDAKPEAAVADASEALDGERPDIERPSVLSGRTTRLLVDMSRQFRDAPNLDVPPEPEALSSL
jgi:penicillin-binding protein 1A